jgi:dihydrofolate reductase
LDGVIQGPGLPDEDREGGFEHGGWQAPYFDEESGKVITEHTARLEALLLGRKTYEIFATYWPQAAASDPIAARLNSAPKYVASRTLDTVEWNNSKLIEGDVADAVAGLKRDRGQIDVIGSGKRLFPGRHRPDRAAAGGVGDLSQGRRAARLPAHRQAHLRQHGIGRRKSSLLD